MPIVLITDEKVLRIPIKECSEPLVDIKNEQRLAYGPPPECELTKDDYTYLRKTVYEKLLKAQDDLPNGWRFRLYDGFRSLEVQEILFNDIYSKTKNRYPGASKEHIFRESTRLVSPVINSDGTVNIPAHNTGAAVDIEIIDKDGSLIDMGMTAADWRDVDPEYCLTACKLISPTAQLNRKQLYEIMTHHGFINYPTEWWHFSYGDRFWAYHTNAEYALYDSADQLKSELRI